MNNYVGFLFHFPASSVRTTVDGQFVALVDDWLIMVLSYIEGDVLGVEPAALEALAQLIGRLHTLPLDAQPQLVLAPARCHPDRIAIAAEQLDRNRTKVPEAFRSLVTNLHSAMIILSTTQLRLSIVHGDCWYRNAIWKSDGSVALIDWDLAGIGSPLLELGNLLLTSHFDFDHPLHLETDQAKIRAIMLGYQQHCSIRQRDGESLANAMRFLLAYQLGSYIADDSRYLHPEFPFVLQKLQARYDATQRIAEIAKAYFSEGISFR
jgi:thiamine kinase-like enzyme